MEVEFDERACPEGAGEGPRADAPYASLDEQFRTAPQDRAIKGQYANIYFARLAKLRPAVLEQVRSQWGLSDADMGAKLFKTLDVPEEADDCIVLGTLYSEMKLKPNVLEEYTRDPLAPAAPILAKYCGPDDTLIIEDETGRLVLSGALLGEQRLVTGVVLAARGRLDASSAFVVSALCVAGVPPQPPLPPSVALADAAAEPLASDQYLALVSGLHVGVDGDGEHLLALQLLCDYLAAHVGDGAELGLQRRIARLVVCGESLPDTDAGKPPLGGEALKPMRARAQKSLAASLQTLETVLLPVAASLPVDLMCASRRAAPCATMSRREAAPLSTSASCHLLTAARPIAQTSRAQRLQAGRDGPVQFESAAATIPPLPAAAPRAARAVHLDAKPARLPHRRAARAGHVRAAGDRRAQISRAGGLARHPRADAALVRGRPSAPALRKPAATLPDGPRSDPAAARPLVPRAGATSRRPRPTRCPASPSTCPTRLCSPSARTSSSRATSRATPAGWPRGRTGRGSG